MLHLLSAYAKASTLANGNGLMLLHRHCQAILSRRNLLSASFSCADAWNSRLSAPDFHSMLSGLDLGNGLLRALDRGEPVAPVDIDVYANKLDSFELSYLPYFANVITKFRATQESLGKLESTDHALVRCMLALDQAELLVQWLRDKFTYGIFLDQYSASLLIDHLLEAGNHQLAAFVAFDHALQDLPSDGLVCTGLMLLATVSRAASQLTEWTAVAPTSEDSADKTNADEEDDEDPDVQHVIVDYIRRPNYDDYFDLDEERLQAGCTLVRIGRRLLANRPGEAHGLACLLLGLAAWEKPDELVKALRQYRDSNKPIPAMSESILQTVDALLASARCLGNGVSDNQPGKRPLCRPESVEQAREAVRLLPKAASVSSPAGDSAWDAELTSFARRLVAEHEAETANRLAALYAQFASVRLAEVRNHSDWLRRRRLYQDVKSRLDKLVGEQESITAFDRAMEIRYAAWLAPRTQAEKSITEAEINAADIANADKLLVEASEAASRGASSKQKLVEAAQLRRSTVIKDKFRPLKE